MKWHRLSHKLAALTGLASETTCHLLRCLARVGALKVLANCHGRVIRRGCINGCCYQPGDPHALGHATEEKSMHDVEVH
jgi:hypothetical protein